MTGEWDIRRIGTLGHVVTGKTPPTVDPDNFGGPYPFITIPDLGGSVFIDRTARTVSARGAETMKSCLLPPGAVMMSCIATIGKCGITTKPSFTNQQINSIIPNEEADPQFLYYVFTQLGQELESAGGGGSVYTNVSKFRFSDIEISLPRDIQQQRAIAHILGTLDNKIELNRQMNETLEAMARSIFKSWFVDFDPVHAKVEGRDPGLPKPLADLIPDSLVGSELGAIPKGWQIRTVGDLADVVGGSTPSTKNPIFWTGGIHNWATPKDLAALNVPVLLDTERRITDAGLTQISSGLLPRGTVLLSSRAPIGYLAISEVAVAINQGFIALKPKGCVSNIYLLLWANFAHDEIISRANGTTFLEISKACFRPIPLVEPPAKVLEAFDIQIRRLFNRIVLNERESRVLTSLRETLLPKLISGEFKLAKGRSNG
jgi:type I restriction enzyme S subunit